MGQSVNSRLEAPGCDREVNIVGVGTQVLHRFLPQTETETISPDPSLAAAPGLYCKAEHRRVRRFSAG
jgi:hypothetical protein